MPAPVVTAVFNVTEPMGSIPGLYSDGTHATDNATNLQSMLKELLTLGGVTNGGGGTLEFPSNASGTAGTASYAFYGGVTIGTDGTNNQPFNIIIRGDGAQARSQPLLQQTQPGQRFFTVSNNPSDAYGDDQIAGIVFQDLIVSFATDDDDTTGVGIYVDTGSSVRIQRVTFDEAPDAALWFFKSLHCSVIDCNVRTQKVSAGTGLRLGGSGSPYIAAETYVAGTTFLAYKTGGTGAELYGADKLRMVNTRFEGWANGLVLNVTANSAGINNCYFGNVSVYSDNAAVSLEVAAGTVENPNFITQVWFAQCEFGIPNKSSTTYSGGGVVIAPTDNSTYVIDQIRFVDCYSCLWKGQGMDVQGGTNIEILGGHYSCNGVSDSGPQPYSSSGISLSGPVNGIRISNVACNNSVFDLTTTPSRGFAAQTQDFGIYVTGGATNVRINGCDLTGNITNGVLVDGNGGVSNIYVRGCDITGYSSYSHAVAVPGVVSSLQVTDCGGYNDQGAVLLGIIIGGNAVIQNYEWGYHGPLEFYAMSNTAMISAINMNGHNTQLLQGSFYVAPGESANVSWSPAMNTIHLLVVGK